ncbi:hypothetical protein V1478_002033 [Vespula squamosa]|uniref:Uncharacterized protein n=1 Tax=Vespula squamosa TaxID=30214 RepID=A0ABD2BYU3_VESSQ
MVVAVVVMAGLRPEPRFAQPRQISRGAQSTLSQYTVSPRTERGIVGMRKHF